MAQNKNEFFSSVIGLGGGAHNLLQQTEIDKSCQTKVSVPINTELRFQSSTMWHDYMLSKCQLGNQSKKEKNMRAWRRLKENEPASIYNTMFLLTHILERTSEEDKIDR